LNSQVQAEAAEAPPLEVEDRGALTARFAGSNAAYYEQQFRLIGSTAGFTWTFNAAAAALGPVWYGLRGIWNWSLAFVILEAFALVQIGRGWWGELATEAQSRIFSIETQLELRRDQLEAATRKGAENLDAFKRNIESLENALDGMQLEVQQAEEFRIWIVLFGIAMLLVVKGVQGVLANSLLERRFSEWLSDRSIKSGIPPARVAMSVLFVVPVYLANVIHFTAPELLPVLAEFPTDRQIRLTGIAGVEAVFDYLVLTGEWVFDAITAGIRWVLDGLEVLFTESPWIVIAAFIVTLTALSAGPRAAMWSGAALAYMGLVGLWDKAMTSLALLGTAACISIGLGIPLGIYCARRPRVYRVVRPIMDFMQTMPAFVYMIPVIAFFGTGKVAAVVTTMVFGGTPVVRLTVLGLRGVPESIREAAIAYGASNWYLLHKVDLPLAAPSIRAGMNQTILLSLAMVVVASLIGAKGLGADVLEALQYASVGLGILAGFAILFLAMILDRIIQGQRRDQ